MSSETSDFDRSVSENVNALLERGSLVAAALGISLALLLAALQAFGLVHDLGLPAVWAGSCGVYSFGFHVLAHFGLLRRAVLRAAFIPLLLSPTIFYLAAEWALPAGAASFITGPPSYLYFVLVLLAAFTFEPVLPYLGGALSAVGYMGVYLLARKHLALLSAPDPTMLQDLQSSPIYLVKAVMMLFAGGLCGALATFSRRLVAKLASEHRDAETLSRLFGEYVSSEVRERLTRPGVVKGERREVALLFSDLRDFTTWSETRPPEQIVETLNVYFDQMVAAITRNGGVVDKFIGDAVMGVFGGLRELENPSAAAFAAARDMRRALAGLNAGWQAKGAPPLNNGIGLHFGEVVQGPLGSARRRDFTVIGDAVNTASRTEGLCKKLGHPLVLTEAVRARLPPLMQAACVALGEEQVKGRREPVSVFGVADDAAEGVAGPQARAG